MAKKIKTLKDLLESKWKSSTCGSDSVDACIRSSAGGVIFTLPTTWGDYQPACFDMDIEELEKTFNLLLYSKEMFLLLEKLDNEEAKKLVTKICEKKNLKME